MKLLRHNQGIGLPTMLAIITFVIAAVATLLTYAVFQARLIDRNFENTEAYYNAVEKAEATANIIVRDQNLESQYLLDLENYMGVSIEPYNATVWTITSVYLDTKSVTSYLTGSASLISTYDNLFSYMGNEPGFTLDPLINPTSLLAAYLSDFLETTFPSLIPQTEFPTFTSIVDYIRVLTGSPGTYVSIAPKVLANQSNPSVSGHWLVNGNLNISKNKNLTVPDGYLLFIDGNLTMNDNSTIFGNVVVNGDLKINSKKTTQEGINGTIYVNGNVNTGTTISLGTIDHPTFVFSELNITFGTNINGYGYFLSENFTVGTGSTDIDIYGGVYVFNSSNLSSQDLIANTNLNESLFYDYAVPEMIVATGGGSSFKFTAPE